MNRRWATRVGRWIWPWSVVLCAVGFFFVALLLAANGVSTQVSEEDRQVITELGVDDHCIGVHSYGDELECVEAVQSAIFERYPDVSDAFVRGVTGHRVTDYDERGYGSCYDRAKLIEQTLRHYGFEVRRVALYEGQDSPLGYVRPGIRSHALSEVRTSKGWLVVESIEPFMGVDEQGMPHSVADIRRGLRAGEVDDETFAAAIPEDFFDGEFVYVYGVYSRHGYFFEPHIPVPEVDWGRFWDNFGR